VSRSRRSFKRSTPFRDAKLIVIVAEGNRTEYQYFTAMHSKEHFFNPRVRVEALDRDPATTGADPMSLIRLLDDYRRSNPELGPGDEFWIVVDRDPGNTSAHQLGEARSVCDQKGYTLCLSSPCFEIWFLMHFIRLHPLRSRNRIALERNAKVNKNRRYVARLLSRLLAGYDKAQPPLKKLFPRTDIAIRNAQDFCINNAMRFPYDLGTQVQDLVLTILARK
jgi:hypothetical protein